MNIKDQIAYMIYGTNRHGETFPKMHGFAPDVSVVADLVVAYREEYRPCDHVNVVMAFPYHK